MNYVIATNRFRRKLSPSQCAAVAVDLLPEISEEVNQKRIEKIRQARLEAAENQTVELIPQSETAWRDVPRTRVLAADLMGVNYR